MARVRLELPSSFHYSTELPIRITDLNYGAHVGNDSILGIIHEARVRFLKHHGYSELDIDGRSIIMSDTVIVYRSESFYGDVLRVDVSVSDFHPFGCDFFYRLTEVSSDREVARAKTSPPSAGLITKLANHVKF